MNTFRFELSAEIQHNNDASNVAKVLKRCIDADTNEMLYIIDTWEGVEFVDKDVLEKHYSLVIRANP